ncbi:hypothetical protein ACWXWU_19410 [Shewanella sp. A14]
MKLIHLTILAVAISMSSQSLAHDKLYLSEDGMKKNNAASVSRAEFLGLDNNHYVQTPKGVQKAQKLSKNQVLVTQNGAPFGTLTGQLVVKLKDGVDAAEFAQSMGLKLEWKNDNNLVIFAAPENAELLSLLESVKATGNVLRAKLDRAVNKHEIQ